MEVKDAIKAIQLRQLLLAPLYLLHEIYAALIPGIVFLFLFSLKGSHFLSAAISVTAMLGYKARLVLLTLVAFVVGKVTLSAVLIVCRLLPAALRWLSGGQKKKPTEADVRRQNLLTGVFQGIILAKAWSDLDLLERHRAAAGFLLNCGVVLLIASCYPGDGLRACELTGGMISVLAGLIQSRELRPMLAHAYGLGLGNFLSQQAADGKIKPTELVEKALVWLDPNFVPGEATRADKSPQDVAVQK